MAYRFRSHAIRRSLVAALVGLAAVLTLGSTFLVPGIALVALVYFTHQLVAVAAGDAGVEYPSVALVIVLNSLVILGVQVFVLIEGGLPL